MSIQHHDDEAVIESQDDELATTDGEVGDEEDFTDTAVLEDETSDNDAYIGDGPVDDFVGESSVVFDVDDLVAEFEAEAGEEEGGPSARLRRRLEAIAERKRRHDDLLDIADYEIDY